MLCSNAFGVTELIHYDSRYSDSFFASHSTERSVWLMLFKLRTNKQLLCQPTFRLLPIYVVQLTKLLQSMTQRSSQCLWLHLRFCCILYCVAVENYPTIRWKLWMRSPEYLLSAQTYLGFSVNVRFLEVTFLWFFFNLEGIIRICLIFGYYIHILK